MKVWVSANKIVLTETTAGATTKEEQDTTTTTTSNAFPQAELRKQRQRQIKQQC